MLGTTSAAAMLEWTNPEGNRAPDYYKVYYSKDGNNYYPLDGTVDAKESTYLVTGLNEDSEYYFRIESYDKDTSMRSVMSAPVQAVTKNGSGPVIIEHPVDCYAKVGEKGLFNIEAKPQIEGNSISYQWQHLMMEDYGISWSDINVASDNTVGRTAEFNAAYASPDGLIRAEDINNLDGNVYRCVVAEHQTGKLDYVEIISNSATLHVGDKVQAAERTLKIEAKAGQQKSDIEILASAGSDITVTADLTDMSGSAIEGTDVHFALLDKKQDGKCIGYLDSKTDSEGKATVIFEDVAAGSYEITAIVKKQADKFKATVSNSIQVTVNESYEIIYELNGGTNHNLNPLEYSVGSRFIILRAASREGYKFTGWYLDPELKNKVEDKWLDVSEMSGTITLYAGWEQIPEDENNPSEPDGPSADPEDPVNPDGPGGTEEPSKPDEPSGSDDPTAPEQPTEPSDEQDDVTGNNTDNDNNPESSTQTGDDSNITPVIVVMLAAIAAVIGALFVRRKK